MVCGRKILIVDGDSAMRATLREQLTRDGVFAVAEAAGAREAEARLLGYASKGAPGYAAVIMDALLPDGDGHAVCAKLRACGLSMPVILLNGANRIDATGDTVSIAKPFRLGELMAHLRARLAPPANTPRRFQLGEYEFRPDEKALSHEDPRRRVRLTEKEVGILAFLYQARDRSVGRRELLTEVWGYNPAVTTHTLETHIYRLRRKIEPEPAKASFLLTEAGGYRLAVP